MRLLTFKVVAHYLTLIRTFPKYFGSKASKSFVGIFLTIFREFPWHSKNFKTSLKLILIMYLAFSKRCLHWITYFFGLLQFIRWDRKKRHLKFKIKVQNCVCHVFRIQIVLLLIKKERKSICFPLSHHTHP